MTIPAADRNRNNLMVNIGSPDGCTGIPRRRIRPAAPTPRAGAPANPPRPLLALRQPHQAQPDHQQDGPRHVRPWPRGSLRDREQPPAEERDDDSHRHVDQKGPPPAPLGTAEGDQSTAEHRTGHAGDADARDDRSERKSPLPGGIQPLYRSEDLRERQPDANTSAPAGRRSATPRVRRRPRPRSPPRTPSHRSRRWHAGRVHHRIDRPAPTPGRTRGRTRRSAIADYSNPVRAYSGSSARRSPTGRG